VFAVIVMGAPGAGKTTTLTALSDALVDERIPHASGDVDDIAWAYPFPDLEGRCEHMRVWAESHRATGADLLLVAEAIESPAHLPALLAAVGADDHLLAHLTAPVDTLRERIVAREPPDWHGLEHLLGEVEPLERVAAELDGVHLVIDTTTTATPEAAGRIRDELLRLRAL
jgi:GTPase SAR1 family protein